MAGQTGTTVRLKVGLITNASSAGSTDTTLDVDHPIFDAVHVGATITDGTFNTTIDSRTDADTVELAAAQDWDDNAEITLEKVNIGGEASLTWTPNVTLVEIRDKDGGKNPQRANGTLRFDFSITGNYVEDDEGQVSVILAALHQAKLAFTRANANPLVTSDDYTGTCLVSQVQIGEATIDGTVPFSANFTATGAVTGPA